MNETQEREQYQRVLQKAVKGRTEKTTTSITGTTTDKLIDLQTVLTIDQQNKLLYTVTFILLLVLFINTYLW